MKVSVMVCAALGGFLFGYDTTVINASLFQMKGHFGFDEHSWQYSLIVAIALAGAFVGAFAAGFISARFGRRPCIATADVLFIIGSVLMAAAPNVPVVLVSRVIVGLAVGISSATIPVYLAEVTSPRHRGATIVLNNVFLTGAQFIAAGFACIMVIYTSNNVGWRVAIGVGAVPAVVQLVGIILFLPESPRWLLCKGNEEEAKLVAERYEVDLAEVRDDEMRTVNMNYGALFQKDIGFRVMLGSALQIIQQFSGINTIMYYSSVVLSDAGFNDSRMPVILSVPLALMNAVFTVIAIFTVDRFGRRVLLIASCGGCLIVTVAVTVVGFMLGKQIPYAIGGWVFLGLLSLFLAVYAPGLGCIPWVVMGEIFPTHLRTSAASVATMANWAANTLVSQVFPLMLGAIGVGGTFAFICGLLTISFIFLWFFAVETKGFTLEQLDNMFRKRAGLPPVYREPEESNDGDNEEYEDDVKSRSRYEMRQKKKSKLFADDNAPSGVVDPNNMGNAFWKVEPIGETNDGDDALEHNSSPAARTNSTRSEKPKGKQAKKTEKGKKQGREEISQ
ncbi:MFS transporter, SP family, solute carrier family 2 (myo-inositol transporter), member 13 [Strigomonas culicis]|uniref:MFS transporter, SP family, solute carrier family 2 (Myo-inositol transporter), member 13 n=1 Tax=Strigomonas culicis TaxID=28005 RepID=S9UKI9_9TRYP|nr:MFS transporter, SP family, solute carrier family 2 (myo-inositol transporter), member 13 [Strigomonas culicis]|eukprot:EPY29289.1 MFS transporter, SP family, solute carrier family 2 (myo-inositol transporter), member 13 [Strigomonas culicis]